MGLVAYPAGWGSPEVLFTVDFFSTLLNSGCEDVPRLKLLCAWPLQDRGRLLDGGGGHCLHLLGLLPHCLRLQVHQEPQDHVQEAGRGEVYLRSITEDWRGGLATGVL